MICFHLTDVGEFLQFHSKRMCQAAGNQSPVAPRTKVNDRSPLSTSVKSDALDSETTNSFQELKKVRLRMLEDKEDKACKIQIRSQLKTFTIQNGSTLLDLYPVLACCKIIAKTFIHTFIPLQEKSAQ